jgi:heme/copper-type cytochrome/quinol oxidase subunit 4
MNKKNTILWVVLMLLMLFNFWLAEMSPVTGKWTLLVILAVTLIKFLGVAFRFMELKEANIRWKAIFIVFILVFTGLAGLI